MKKILFKSAAVLTSLVLVFMFVAMNFKMRPLAASSKIYYVTASVGETYETTGINYHCDEDGSYVIYGTNSNLATYETAQPTSNLWSVEANPDDVNTGFSARYVCKATLTNLSPATRYYYQIVLGSEKSKVYSFKTPANDGSSTSFAFLTDTQSADVNTFNKVNDLAKALKLKDQNLNMVYMTGDIVDRGGYSAQWDAFFKGCTEFEGYQQGTLPGNHEYYHDDDPGYIDASFYNAFYNNPQNGPSDRLNSSYYFIYNEILFINLDTISRNNIDLEAHKAWFRQVVAEHPTRWIIVGSHAGCISAGVYAYDASYMMSNWQEVFEECQVDLALSGHEHIYIRKELYYQGSRNEELGVTYLVGPAAGQKDYAAQTTEGFDQVLRGNYRGQIIKTQGSKMTVTLYDTSGTSYASFTLNAKRSGEPWPLTDQEMLDSIAYSYNESDNTLDITWSPDLWGNIKSISCTGDDTWSQVISSSSTELAYHRMHAVYNDRNYTYTINLLKSDGTTISKELPVTFVQTVTPTFIRVSSPGTIRVGETAQLSVVLEPTGAPQEANYASEDPSIAIVDENGLITAVAPGSTKIVITTPNNPNLERKLTVRVAYPEGTYQIAYNLDGGTNASDAPVSYQKGVGTALPTPTKEGYTFLGWYNGETKYENIPTTAEGNISLTARWEVASTPTPPDTPTEPEPEKSGCGCKKSLDYIFALTASLSLLVILLKKKH